MEHLPRAPLRCQIDSACIFAYGSTSCIAAVMWSDNFQSSKVLKYPGNINKTEIPSNLLNKMLEQYLAHLAGSLALLGIGWIIESWIH